MTINEFKDVALAMALEKGCAAAEVFFVEGQNFSITIREGDLDTYQAAREFGVSLRVKLDGKDGYAYTEALDQPEVLVEKAMDNARAIEVVDEHPMQGASEYETIEKSQNPMELMSEKDKIEFATELERRIKAADPRVVRVQSSNVMSDAGRVCIYNTLGLCAEKKYDQSLAYVMPIMVQDENPKIGIAFRAGKKVLDIDGMVAEAIEETAMQLGALPVPAGTYDIVLRHTASASLLDAFSSMFSASAAQNGMSLLADKEGTVITNELITIVDNPFHEESPRAFDAEGVPSMVTTIVDKGTLKTLLHNLKTAKKAGVKSTSNAGRSLTTPIDVSPSVLYIEAGTDSYDELITKLNNGLVITDLSGLHAGVNPISGEFSLLASGLLVENGQVVRSVDQITIGGSFLGMLNNVVSVGNDTKFGLPFGAVVGSPSLLIRNIQISGK